MSILMAETDVRFKMMKKELSSIFPENAGADKLASKIIDAILVNNAIVAGGNIFVKDDEENKRINKKLSLFFHSDKQSINRIDVESLTDEQKAALKKFFKKWLDSKYSSFINQDITQSSLDNFFAETFKKIALLKEQHDELMQQIKESKELAEREKAAAEATAAAKASKTGFVDNVRNKMDNLKKAIYSAIEYAASYFTNRKFDPKELNKRTEEASQALVVFVKAINQNNLTSEDKPKIRDVSVLIKVSQKVIDKLRKFSAAASELKQSSGTSLNNQMGKMFQEANNLCNSYFTPLAEKVSKQMDNWVVQSVAKAFMPFMSRNTNRQQPSSAEKNHQIRPINKKFDS